MAGIFDQLMKPRKQVLFLGQHIQPTDTKILGEVFGAEPEDVDGMIKARVSGLMELY
jgi:hypothetical protein